MPCIFFIMLPCLIVYSTLIRTGGNTSIGTEILMEIELPIYPSSVGCY